MKTKRKFKTEYLFILLFVIMIVVFLSLSINTVAEKLGTTNQASGNSSEEIEIDWEELYPFENNEITNDENYEEVSNLNSGVLNNVKGSISFIANTISNYAGNNTDKIIGYETEKTIGVKIMKALDKSVRYKQGDLQQLDNGQIMEVETREDDDYADDTVKNCVQFNDYLKEKNIQLLYVQPCVKYDDTGKYSNSINENRDILISKLKNSGINYLDLRNNAITDGLTVNEMFYKTDHHWKTSMGLWATQNIISKINNNDNLYFDTSILDTSNFYLKTYKNAMFGSYGDAAGKLWIDDENHPVYYPRFNTKFQVKIPNKQIDNIGAFSDVLFNNEMIEQFSKKNAGYIYETTCYGNTPLMQIKNMYNLNAPKVLVIRDSFGLAILPYLSCICSEVDSIDVRPSNGNFTGSVHSYIEKFKPDLVIIISQNPQSFFQLNK